MKSLGQLLIGIITAAGSGLLVLAAISLALVEGGTNRANVLPSPSATAGTGILTPAGGVTLQPKAAQVVTATLAPSNCTPPAGWISYTVQNGDDLNSIAAQTGLSTAEILRANCMVTTTLLPGKFLYVPFMPTETATPTDTSLPPTQPPCGPPSNWVVYTVRSGDTLSYLSKALGVTVPQIQKANCLSGEMIRTGMQLHLPAIPPPRAVPTSAPTALPSATMQTIPTIGDGTLPVKPGRTETATPEPPTATPETPTPETVTVVPPTAEPPTTEITPADTATQSPTKVDVK